MYITFDGFHIVSQLKDGGDPMRCYHVVQTDSYAKEYLDRRNKQYKKAEYEAARAKPTPKRFSKFFSAK